MGAATNIILSVAKANVSRQALVEAIASLESQREPADRALERAVDTALAALRDKLAELQSDPGDHQQRQLAVLVADLSGFTALSERMDAEKVRDALNAMWRVLDAVILAHGGQIDQHAGDSLLALFGLPQPRTSDAARALRAALTLQMELVLFNERVRQAADAGQGAVWAGDWPGPAMRVGVHSGPVYFARAAGSARLTAVGETITVARRLEHAAPAGQVLASVAVQRQAATQVQLDAAPEELAAAANRAPGETVYLATGERPDPLTFAPALVAGQVTRLIGRDEPLDQLENALQAAIDSGAPQVVTLLGAAGAGKSRLVHEFEARARLLTGLSGALRADGRLFPVDAPYALVRDLLLRRFGIRPQHSHFIIEERLRRVLDALDRPEHGRRLSTTGRLDSTLELLKQLLDARTAARLPLDDVQQLVERLLGAITAAGPAVLVLEDVHRADRQSLALVDRLARAGGALPVLVLAVAAGEDGQTAGLPWLGREDDPFSPVSRLAVTPLSAVESRLMATDILGQLPPPPMRLLDLIVAESGGNPLYIEAFTRLLMQRGVISVGERRAVDMAQAERTRLPAGLAKLIETRQLALAGEEQRVLQAAAVVGSLFWDAALMETRAPLLDDMSEPEIEAALLSLEHKRFILRDTTYSFGASQAYRFRREVGHAVAYDSLAAAARRAQHRSVAQWLVAHQSDDHFRAWFPADGLIAHHFAAAEEPAQAAVWQRRAGQMPAVAGM